jgi:putative transposase
MFALRSGHTEDRDINSAQVCLTWASGQTPRHPRTLGNADQERGQELSSLDVESLSSTDCGSMKQLGMKKRRKPQASALAACA